jgi:hypothetical protein
MWITSHVGLEGKELVDERARHAPLNGAFFDRPLSPVDFQRMWQGKWDDVDTGRLAHFILPRVSLPPWFEGQSEDRKFVSTVSRIRSGHCVARSHLSRFRIVEDTMCVCLKDYERPLDMGKIASRSGFMCSEEVAGDEVLSGFPRRSWN